jgi:hypothetical protein
MAKISHAGYSALNALAQRHGISAQDRLGLGDCLKKLGVDTPVFRDFGELHEVHEVPCDDGSTLKVFHAFDNIFYLQKVEKQEDNQQEDNQQEDNQQEGEQQKKRKYIKACVSKLSDFLEMRQIPFSDEDKAVVSAYLSKQEITGPISFFYGEDVKRFEFSRVSLADGEREAKVTFGPSFSPRYAHLLNVFFSFTEEKLKKDKEEAQISSIVDPLKKRFGISDEGIRVIRDYLKEVGVNEPTFEDRDPEFSDEEIDLKVSCQDGGTFAMCRVGTTPTFLVQKQENKKAENNIDTVNIDECLGKLSSFLKRLHVILDPKKDLALLREQLMAQKVKGKIAYHVGKISKSAKTLSLPLANGVHTLEIEVRPNPLANDFAYVLYVHPLFVDGRELKEDDFRKFWVEKGFPEEYLEQVIKNADFVQPVNIFVIGDRYRYSSLYQKNKGDKFAPYKNFQAFQKGNDITILQLGSAIGRADKYTFQ